MFARTLCLALALGPLAAAQGFVDTTDSVGLGGTYLPFLPPGLDAPTLAGGVAVFDYDNDGWDDVFWPAGDQQAARLFHNDGGTFTDVAATAGVDVFAPISSPSFADYDNDGDFDLFLTTYMNYSYEGEPAAYRNIFYRNEGDGTFTDVTFAAGLQTSGRTGATWGDLDDDGWIDMVGVTWSLDDNTYFFRNRGDGTFVDKTPPDIKADLIFGFSPAIIDYDADGDNDILCVADFQTSRVWRNEGRWSFTIANGTILDGGDLDDDNGMGATIGDFNRDGVVDWIATSTYTENPPVGWTPKTGNRMYMGVGDGTFTDMTDETGIRDGGWAWAADLGDLNNDAFPDLVHVNGYYLPGFPSQQFLEVTPARVFVNDGTGFTTDQATALGVGDPYQGRGCVLFDYNQDGKQDILTANHDVGLALYENQQTVGNFLDVRVKALYGNPFGPGTKVTVWEPTIGTQTDWIHHGCNYVSQGPPACWFGLGSATRVRVEVVFPSGIAVVQYVDANQRIVIEEPESGHGVLEVMGK